MGSFRRQVAALAILNLRSAPRRLGLTLAMVTAVALVVVVLLAFLALDQGFRRTLAQSGSDDVAIVVRGGAQSEINSLVTREQVDLLRSAPGVLALSPEVGLVVDGRRSDDVRSTIALRGLGPDGIGLRGDFRLLAGRLPAPGAPELIVGRTLLRDHPHLRLGSVAEWGRGRWTVVGMFETAGGVAETEIWADLAAVQNLFNRANTVQSVRIRLAAPGDLAALSGFIEAEPRLRLTAKSERAYHAEQAARTSDLIRRLGWPLAVMMAFGALAGAANTMYAAVSARAGEIATLRAVGFSPGAVFLGSLVESVTIASLAGLLGAAIAYAAFNGMAASALGGGVTQVGFGLLVGPETMARGVMLACAIGLLGGFAPALSAARRPIATLLGR